MFLRSREAMSNNKGFTLIELMVVIAVIGILAAIIVPRFTGVRESAVEADGESLLRNIQSGLEMYITDHFEFGDNVDLYDAEGIDKIFDYTGNYIDVGEPGDWDIYGETEYDSFIGDGTKYQIYLTHDPTGVLLKLDHSEGISREDN